MQPQMILFTIVCAIFLALLEIEIEGGNGWSQNIPTKKIKNPFRKIIGWPYFTGYHLCLWLLSISFFHLPFVFGFSWTLAHEILVIELLFFFLCIEDFFWFLFNPKWGIKRFFKEEIPWHPHKIFYLPQNYWLGFLLLGLIEIMRNVIS